MLVINMTFVLRMLLFKLLTCKDNKNNIDIMQHRPKWCIVPRLTLFQLMFTLILNSYRRHVTYLYNIHNKQHNEFCPIDCVYYLYHILCQDNHHSCLRRQHKVPLKCLHTRVREDNSASMISQQ